MEEALDDLLTTFSRAEKLQERVRAAEAMLTAKLVNKGRVEPRFEDGLGFLLTAAAETPVEKLKAIATAYRLGASSKPVRAMVERIAPATLVYPLPPLDLLTDGQDRYYASLSVFDSEAEWVLPYAARGVAREETAETARVVLAKRLLKSVSIADGLSRISAELEQVVFETEKPAESAAKRLARVIGAIRPAIVAEPLPPGVELGDALRAFFRSPFLRVGSPPHGSITNALAKACCELVYDILRTQITVVADPDIYRSLLPVREWIGVPLWPRFVKNNRAPQYVLGALEGAIVLLAKQHLADQRLLDVLLLFVASKDEAVLRTVNLANSNVGLASDIRDWLTTFGKVRKTPVLGSMSEAREAGSDPAIAALLVMASMTACDSKDERSQAALTQRLISGIRSLGAARGLALKSEVGDIVEYLPAAHELVGGHALGVRRVRILAPLVERIGMDGTRTVIHKALVEAEGTHDEQPDR
jgi:hypothetical protein